MSFFDSAYLGTPPWDIGREQSAFKLVSENYHSIQGPILDIGCGTGENSLFFAHRGYDVTGIDTSNLAITKALKKAVARHLHDKASFLTMDLFNLSGLDQKFNTIIDCGVFHMFNESSRLAYQKSIKTVLNKKGILIILAFSYLEPLGIGPSQRLTKSDYNNIFKSDWKIKEFLDVEFETRSVKKHAKGLLTIIERI